MSEFAISIPSGESRRLKTAGKYCPANILVSKKIAYLVIISLLVMCIALGCAKKENNVEAIETTVRETTNEIVVTEPSETEVEMTETFTEILPEPTEKNENTGDTGSKSTTPAPTTPAPTTPAPTTPAPTTPAPTTPAPTTPAPTTPAPTTPAPTTPAPTTPAPTTPAPTNPAPTTPAPTTPAPTTPPAPPVNEEDLGEWT